MDTVDGEFSTRGYHRTTETPTHRESHDEESEEQKPPAADARVLDDAVFHHIGYNPDNFENNVSVQHQHAAGSNKLATHSW